MWQLEKSIDLLRIPGDIALAASFPILWLRLYLFGPRGVSVETQILHLITFVARYAHPGSFSLGLYNSFMKGWLLGASLTSVILLFFLLRQNVCSTIISRPFSSPAIIIILPAFILSLFIHYPVRAPPSIPTSPVPQTTMINITWAFSQYLAAGAMIPQLGMMARLAGYAGRWDTASNAVMITDYDSMPVQKSVLEDADAMKEQSDSAGGYSSPAEEDDDESKSLLLPYFPPTIPVDDSSSDQSRGGFDDDIESQRSLSQFPPACYSPPPSPPFHDFYPFKSLASPYSTSSSWLASTWLNVDTLLWAYLASVSLFRIFYIHHWTWRYRIRGTHDPISLASACTQLVVCGAGVFAIWLSCASTSGYEWRMKGTGRIRGEVWEGENETHGDEDENVCQVGVGTSLGVPRIEVTNVDDDKEGMSGISQATSHPRPRSRPPSRDSLSSRKKLTKGKGRRRGDKGGRRPVGVQPGTLDTIVEAPELEGELVEVDENESLEPRQARGREGEDAWGLENDGFVLLALTSPSGGFNGLRSHPSSVRVSQPNLLHPLWTRTSP